MRTVTKRKVTREEANYSDTCDKCGKPSGDCEATDRYDVQEVEIVMKLGSSYPGDYSATHTVVDCCTECFTKHVLPALVALGFKPREEDA